MSVLSAFMLSVCARAASQRPCLHQDNRRGQQTSRSHSRRWDTDEAPPRAAFQAHSLPARADTRDAGADAAGGAGRLMARTCPAAGRAGVAVRSGGGGRAGKGRGSLRSCSCSGATWLQYTCASPMQMISSPARRPHTCPRRRARSAARAPLPGLQAGRPGRYPIRIRPPGALAATVGQQKPCNVAMSVWAGAQTDAFRQRAHPDKSESDAPGTGSPHRV